ncbi:MAG: FAD/NAD(P)-binding protein [Deltaproteobacteria bacterium]|nr:FAD/NAD(P)-binding protein [Deltaproteobacteria bacterium]
MLEWLVVGAGIHGTLLAHRLLASGRVSRDRLRLLDPHDEPLSAWRLRAETVGMPFLRSPSVHHLAVEPGALVAFAAARDRGSEFIGAYGRPSTALFAAHCRDLVMREKLCEVCVRAEARGLTRSARGFRVETTSGALKARNVLVAHGRSRLTRPAWTRELAAAGARVAHVFEPGIDAALAGAQRIAIVGGGITAAQLAVRLAERAQLTVIARHPIREHDFDSDPGWLGPRHLADFARLRDPEERRARIRKARNRGSLPRDVALAVDQARTRSALDWRKDEVRSAGFAGGTIALDCASGARLSCDAVALATGFAPEPARDTWLGDAVDVLGLPCAPCGSPLVDGALRWAPGLFVSGALAELEIGPAAPNIAGARMAAERILAAL